MCCNGVIFADVQLQPGDDAARLRELGLQLSGVRLKARTMPSGQPKPSAHRARQGLKFPQPCAALDGCTCRIYSQRPTYCRQFECLLLNNVSAGRVQRETAAKIIGEARARADKVRRLLRELGDHEESLALSLRFQRMTAALEAAELDEETAARYGALTLAVHDLNCLLSEAFYPGT